MTHVPDHYATLGVSPESDDVVIRAAYKALMLKYHPDTNKSSDATKRAAAINHAFAILGDPDRRRQYDKQRTPSQAKAQTTGSSRPSPPPPSPPTPPTRPPRDAAPATPPNSKAARSRSNFFSRWGLAVAILLAFGLIRTMVNHNGSTSSSAALTAEDGMITDMNATEAMDAMSVNMTAADPPLETESSTTALADLSNDSDAISYRGRFPATSINFADIENAAITFERILQQGGILGARAYSEECHERVEKAPSWSAADRCAAFDFAARYIDASVAEAGGVTANGYFAFKADNEADIYDAITHQTWLLPDRLRRIRDAVQPAVAEAILEGVARRKEARSSTDPARATLEEKERLELILSSTAQDGGD